MRPNPHGILPVVALCLFATASLSNLYAQDSLGIIRLAELRYDWDIAYDVEVVGHYAYIADGKAGLRIVDVSNREHPEQRGFFQTRGKADDVTVSGNLAFVGGTEVGGIYRNARGGTVRVPGFYIIDVTDPAAPRELAFCDSVTGYKDVIAFENYVFVVNNASDEDLVESNILDITDPSNPVGVGQYHLLGNPSVGVIDGHYLFFGTNRGLEFINVENPEEPEWIGNLREVGAPMAVSNQFIYLWGSGENDIEIYEFFGNDVLAYQDHIRISEDNNLNFIRIAEEILHVSVHIETDDVDADFLIQYDVSDLRDIVQVSVLELDFAPNDLEVIDGVGYCAMGTKGLKLLDFSNPAEPIWSGSYCDAGFTTGLTLQDGYLYTAHSVGGWSAIDVREPTAPVEVGFFDENRVNDIAISGHHLFAGNPELVFNIENPTNPVQIRPFDYNSETAFVSLEVNSNEMIGNTSNGQTIYNIDVPERTARIGYINSGASQSARLGEAIVGVRENGALTVWDITRPAAPKQLATYQTSLGYLDVQVRDSLAFVACSDPYGIDGNMGALQVIDLRNVFWPTERLFLPLPAPARTIELQGDFAFIACADSGIRILDISNLDNVRQVGFYDTPGIAKDLFVENNLIYLSDSLFVGIYDCSEAIMRQARRLRYTNESSGISAVFPNPANAAVTIGYDAPYGITSLLAYDQLGRVVADLTPRSLQHGFGRRIGWDVSSLPTGEYVVRMESSGRISDRRISIVK